MGKTEEKLDPLQNCFKRMEIAVRALEVEKRGCAEALELAYEEYGNSLEFGDEVVEYKPLLAIVKAYVGKKTEKFQSDLTDTNKAVLHVLGVAVQGSLFDGGADNADD